ncbi:hypothetical protein [Saccharopolyspora rosea]|uniref:Uncharacterized protein n=1 Tax=Saccharopolyspora rosea TaxID=524884 RepID=A0ABW3FRG1_9PSEU|nr:hypothetical protein [Saccharopolyspora rosea]
MTTPKGTITRETMIGPFPLPKVTDELRAEARSKQPGEWIVFADPAVRPGVTPPRFAVQGGYQVGNGGRLTDYHINPAYEPSSVLTGFKFANGLELTLWRTLHGYNPLGMLADSFYHAELLAYGDNSAGIPVVTDPSDSTSVIPVCTSAQWTAWEQTHPVEGSTILSLAEQARDVLVDINPGTTLSLRLSLTTLAGLITSDTPHLVSRPHPDR